MKTHTTTLLVGIALLSLLLTPAASLGLDVGDTAPPFTGDSTLGNIRLADFLGKQNVVLALYFAVFTPV